MAYDLCANCNARGNLQKCAATSCAQHDSWMAIELKSLLAKGRDAIDKLPGYPQGADIADEIDSFLTLTGSTTSCDKD